MPTIFADQGREVVITGYGSITNIGSGSDTVWSNLDSYQQDAYPSDPRFNPFKHRGFVEFDTSRHIKKPSSLRAMSCAQIASTCAAGMALDKAGLKSRADLLENMPVIMTCNGSQRHDELDDNIHRELAWNNVPVLQREGTLNKLLKKMRPTLFLAQLPNLFTANIAMNLGVTGECATVLGEEEAGVNTVEIACRRIASGQNDMILVGGTFDGSDKYLQMLYAYSGLLQRDGDSATTDSFSLGSAASFLVLESRQHAQARGANTFARFRAIDQNLRVKGDSAVNAGSIESLQSLLGSMEKKLKKHSLGVLLASVGKRNIEEEARVWINSGRQNEYPQIRTTAGVLGYLREASLTTHITIAIGCLQRGRMYRRTCFDSDMGFGASTSGAIDQVAVSIIGKHCGEAIALLEAENG